MLFLLQGFHAGENLTNVILDASDFLIALKDMKEFLIGQEEEFGEYLPFNIQKILNRFF
jgi:hypothetical protein